eukprot:GHVR01040201.1.p2 GENE.GHVR01040201.1~~GHVR01040201.1.p2  ORF type:complete len:104 (-),score=14.23 GHVR01040201.1:328-639(-)
MNAITFRSQVQAEEITTGKRSQLWIRGKSIDAVVQPIPVEEVLLDRGGGIGDNGGIDAVVLQADLDAPPEKGEQIRFAGMVYEVESWEQHLSVFYRIRGGDMI